MLAILDTRQNRHTLGRPAAVAASIVLALLVLPLAALRPFDTSTEARVAREQPAATTPASSPEKSERLVRGFGDSACDSAIRLPKSSVSLHIVDADDSNDRVIEYLANARGRCVQGAIMGNAVLSNDRLISLGENSYAWFRELEPGTDRSLRVTPRGDGTMEFAARLDGAGTKFDDSTRAWFARLLPEVLTEAGVNAPQRVARDMARGGVALVLQHIGRIQSAASRRAHYEALLDGKPLTDAEYELVRRHATRTLDGSPTDLAAVLRRTGAGPATGTRSLGEAVARLGAARESLDSAIGHALGRNSSSSDSASTLTKYGVTDDPDMMLVALEGTKSISSSTDKRAILVTVAAGVLRRKNTALRTAYFDAVATIESDTDLRAVLETALPWAHADQAVAFAVFREVKDHLSSDTDKRAVLITAVEQSLLGTPQLRTAFMAAARSIENSTDYTAVLKSAFKQ